ncbi:hypothetical protein GCK32_004231 [Trichostrongylus colubriformis]|uniref:Uncharacterized protein n=1 Tax=Trichostrongylus colubriformis TaxID=6319 RepID=A0AAN8FLV8_TRICO
MFSLQFEPSASFLNSERKRDESHEDNTIHDAPSLVNVKISRASDELISLSLKGKDDRKKQKAATPPPPAMPKEVKAEELLVLQPTIGSIHEELPTSKKKIIRTDKTLPSAET